MPERLQLLRDALAAPTISQEQLRGPSLTGGRGPTIISTMVEMVAAVPERDVSAELAAFFRLLADPTRRRIFLLLMEGETCNCEITGQLGLPQNLISHHLRALREAGLVRSRRDERDARWIYYWIDPQALSSVCGDFQAVFSPSAPQARAPRCGPALKGGGQ